MIKNKILFCLILVMGCQDNSEEQENYDLRNNANKEKIYADGTVYVEAGSRAEVIKFDWVKERFNCLDEKVKDDKVPSKMERSPF